MTKHYPFLDEVSDTLNVVPHAKVSAISHAIRVCNSTDSKTHEKAYAVLRALVL